MLKIRPSAQEAQAREARVGCGIGRLDDLLDGGLPAGSATLVIGPAFVGKELLPARFVLEGLRTGAPAVVVTTRTPVAMLRRKLAAIDPGYQGHEEAGLVRFVDAHSRLGGHGLDAGQRHAEFVDGPEDLEGIARAVDHAMGRFSEARSHRLVVDSLSTIAACARPEEALRFTHHLLARAQARRATCMLALERGMHPDPEIQGFLHLVDGAVELKREGGKALLHAQGLGLTEDRGWVEYSFTATDLHITGSFSVGRIR
jgi:KaiC/GvpD/RAD55 family RecA-like ATPase